MIQLSSAGKGLGRKLQFENLDWLVTPRDRAGLVGANGAGMTTAYQDDDADRLVAVTDAAQNLTIYGYDTENNLVDITDAACHQTGFAYDAFGRITQVTFPSTLSESYTYDTMNNLPSKTDRKGETTNYAYDALYRLTSKTYPDSAAVNHSYDLLSRLTQVTDPTGVYGFSYDNLGRLLGTSTQYSFLSGTQLTNTYGYDAASNRVSFTNPQSQITNYVYDALNRLTGITDFNSGQFGFGYDALGRRASLTRPNGVGTSYSYDRLSRLLSVLRNGGSLPGSASYTYDSFGFMTASIGSATNWFRYTGRQFDSSGGGVNIFPGNYEDYLWRKEGKEIDLILSRRAPLPSADGRGESYADLLILQTYFPPWRGGAGGEGVRQDRVANE